ncbi:M23 family metallopeptidase [Arenimonas sp.]|uniref:M23 family metallopeptidase n=1 Tax=Arenimonas sp. TaxID=1872635 RepID=UPI0039E308B1
MRYRFLLLSLLPLAALAADDGPDVRIAAEPATIRFERFGDHRALNFELRIDNRSDVAVAIDRLQVSAYDAKGELLLRRFVDGNGVRPSVQTLGGRDIAAGDGLTVFNPFERFPAELPIARLSYRVELSNEDGSRKAARDIDVAPSDYRNGQSLRLPLAGRMINYDGHDLLGHHRRFDVHFAPIAAMGFTRNFMRYSYDFVTVDKSGEMFAGSFARNEDWFGFGRPILSVGDGVVVAVANDEPDNRSFDQSRLAAEPMVLFGNYVLVDHGHGEFGVYAHARQGSVRVRPGQRVARGETLAAIGASGSAFFPHLHFQLQSAPGIDAEGLPSYFDGFSRVIGTARMARQQATVDTGEIVEFVPAP